MKRQSGKPRAARGRQLLHGDDGYHMHECLRGLGEGERFWVSRDTRPGRLALLEMASQRIHRVDQWPCGACAASMVATAPPVVHASARGRIVRDVMAGGKRGCALASSNWLDGVRSRRSKRMSD